MQAEKQSSHPPFHRPMPKVSVVVVSYNQAGYILEALESVLHQTFRDFEIIIVDDGSRDGSIHTIQKIINRYGKDFPIIFCRNAKNTGISRAYQTGVANASGEYIAFLEADDRWDKTYLEKKVEILDDVLDVGVVFSRYRIISRGLTGLDMRIRQQLLRFYTDKKRPFNNFKNLLKRNNIATFSTFVTRKSLLERVSFHLPKEIYFLDWWILVQLAMKTNFLLDKSALIGWRQHQESALGKQRFERHKTMVCEYMVRMYENVGDSIVSQEEGDRRYYSRKKEILPAFCRFYTRPNILNFARFLRVDPFWATESATSYMINRWKYA